jgi:flagellar assembly protein FliH
MSQAPRVVPDAVLMGAPLILTHRSPLGGDAFTPHEKRLQAKAFEAGRAEGLEAGHEQGLAEGRRRAEADLAKAREALASGLRALEERQSRFLADGRDAVLRLALAVARKVIHDEISPASRRVAARVVAAAVESARDATPLRVRVNPADQPRIEQAGGAEHLPELVADPAISSGGCIVETDCGWIDATVESQWATVRSALEEAAGELDELPISDCGNTSAV